MKTVFAALSVVLFAPAAFAGEGAIESRYDVSVKGVTVMKLQYQARINDDRYQSSIVAKTTGMAKWLSKYRIQYASEGSIAGGRFVPMTFSRERKKNGRESQTGFQWKAGVPLIDGDDVRGPERVQKAVADGATDPLAFLLSLGLTGNGNPCKGRHRVFDGRDVMEATLAGSPGGKGEFECRITAKTIAGRAYENAEDKSQLVDEYLVTFRTMDAPFLGRSIYVPVRVSGTASGQAFQAEAEDIGISGGATN